MEIIKQKQMILKSLLLKAWRERWSDVQWSAKVKGVLQKGTSGDVYNLAEMLLSQALIGPSPNTLILSYLKHAISSQVVSYAAVLTAMVRYEDLFTSRPYCMRSLLDLLVSCAHKISCHGNAEECLILCQSLLTAVHWLLRGILHAFEKQREIKETLVIAKNIEMCSEVLKRLCEAKHTRGLLYIGRLEDENVWNGIEQVLTSIRNTLVNQQQQAVFAKELREKVDRYLVEIQKLQNHPVTPLSVSMFSSKASSCTINIMTYMEAILNITIDIQPFVDQLLLVETIQKLYRSTVYLELMRASLIGTVDSAGGNDELKWAAFTYLKLPQVLLRLKSVPPSDGSAQENSEILNQALEQLLRFLPLLDAADTKCNCDCMQYLLQEFNKYGLMSEMQVSKILQKRAAETQRIKSPDVPPTQPNASLILRAEPTVTNILKTLDADYSKSQEALLGVLGHMMSGKSFELILAAAAATGKLKKFAGKLIKFNEFAKQTSGEGSKASYTRALLYDISFLMLCHIAQLYGVEMVTANGGDSFFENWATQCLPDDNGAKPLELALKPEQSKLDHWLSVISTGSEMKTSLTKWHEMCIHMPYTMQEALNAWEHAAITTDHVQKMVDNVRSRMCCIPVCIAAWLCSHISVLGAAERNKPTKMLQMFMVPLSGEPIMQFSNERSILMMNIIKKMCSTSLDTWLTGSSSGGTAEVGFTIPLKKPTKEVLHEVFSKILKAGCVDKTALIAMDQIINVSGIQWFCESIVNELLSLFRKDDLQIAVEVIITLFQVDIEQLTLALIRHVLTQILNDPSQWQNLSDPRGHALATLSVWCIAAAQTSQNSYREARSKESAFKPLRGRKRVRTDVEKDESGFCKDESRPSKLRRLLSTAEEDNNTATLAEFAANGGIMMLMSHSQQPQIMTDPFNRALASLFQLFASILAENTIGPRSEFVMSFVKDALQCGEGVSRSILQFMPVNMISQLFRSSLAGTFPSDLALAVCDLELPMGRKIAAKMLCLSRR
ncbi:mediator of RNA polymerase II transcription subunit 24-like isoform X2 [Ptychodera flava]|uniref:mediator of RNA polymerase II transcription subunit 24-like isoform X2 n=1 Tax=Ptychodera flava TaxID=63121 RepID=UPI00396AA64A